jgi:hypothetical protein
MQYFNLGGGNGIRIATSSAPPAPSYDPDAQLFFDAQAAAGVTLSTTEMDATNQLVLDLKTYSIWNELYFMHIYVGNSPTAHKFNLVNPVDSNAAFRLSFIGGWTHSSTGALPNGVNAYADTFFTPSSNINTTDLSCWGYYSRSNTAKSSEYVMGSNSLSTQAQCALIIRRNTNLSAAISDFPSNTSYRQASANVTDGTGFFIGNQQGNDLKLYRNGSIIASNTNGSVNQPISTYAVVIGAIRSFSGTPIITGYTDKECALDFSSKALTDTQVADLTTAVQNFQTTLSRQV